jgi:hypothetical protein
VHLPGPTCPTLKRDQNSADAGGDVTSFLRMRATKIR